MDTAKFDRAVQIISDYLTKYEVRYQPVFREDMESDAKFWSVMTDIANGAFVTSREDAEWFKSLSFGDIMALYEFYNNLVVKRFARYE